MTDKQTAQAVISLLDKQGLLSHQEAQYLDGKPMAKEPSLCPECGEDKLFWLNDYVCAECRQQLDR